MVAKTFLFSFEFSLTRKVLLHLLYCRKKHDQIPVYETLALFCQLLIKTSHTIKEDVIESSMYEVSWYFVLANTIYCYKKWIQKWIWSFFFQSLGNNHISVCNEGAYFWTKKDEIVKYKICSDILTLYLVNILRAR